MPNSKELTEKWYSDTANRPHLAGLLNDPVMREALTILQAIASEPVPPPNFQCDLTQYGALMGFTRNGAFNILKALEDLARTKPSKPPEVPPFDREAQDKFAKRP